MNHDDASEVAPSKVRAQETKERGAMPKTPKASETTETKAKEQEVEKLPDPKDPRFEGYKWVGNGYVHDVYAFDIFSDTPDTTSAPAHAFFPNSEPQNLPETPQTPSSERCFLDCISTPRNANSTFRNLSQHYFIFS